MVFDSAHFNFCIIGLPSRCYTPKIGLRLATVLEDNRVLEICSSRRRGIVQFFRIPALLRVKKPLYRCILVQIPGTGKVKAMVQYEKLPTFCFFCGRIGHIFTHCDILKNKPHPPSILQDNMPNPESLEILDKSLSDILFHTKLSLSAVAGPLLALDQTLIRNPNMECTLPTLTVESPSSLLPISLATPTDMNMMP